MGDQQGFPKINQAFVDTESGIIAQVWQKLLQSLWQKAGGGASSTASAVFIYEDPSGNINAADSETGSDLGSLMLFGPGAVSPVVVGVSPFTYTATSPGLLAVSGGTIELSRSGSPFYTVSAAGGAIPMLTGDQVRITYGVLPVVGFFANN